MFKTNCDFICIVVRMVLRLTREKIMIIKGNVDEDITLHLTTRNVCTRAVEKGFDTVGRISTWDSPFAV